MGGVMNSVLVIDDDTRMLKLIKDYLQDIYDVYPIKSGPQALDFLKDAKPDVILLDYQMPRMDGPSTLKEIRKIEGCEEIPVFFLTGMTEKEVVDECMEYRPRGYLMKPVARVELLRALDKIS